MLFVRSLGCNRYRARLELLDERQQAGALFLRVACIFFAQALPEQSPDADANQPVRQQIALQPPVQTAWSAPAPELWQGLAWWKWCS